MSDGIHSDDAGSRSTGASSAEPLTTAVYYDSHMHTPLCRHAVGWPDAYAETALQRGLKGITFTCHSPMPPDWFPQVRMRYAELDAYVDLIHQSTRHFSGRLDVRLGLESDWFPGMEPWLAQLHAEAPFSYILGSVHYFGPEYQAAFGHLQADAFARQYFLHLAESAETGLFDCLAHPDLVKNDQVDTWDFDRLRDTVETALDRIAKTGVAMELNTSGRLKRFKEMNPSLDMLRLMCERQIPVVIGSDAHRPDRVSDGFEDALTLLEQAGYRHVSYFIDRQRRELAIPLARASLVEVAASVA